MRTLSQYITESSNNKPITNSDIDKYISKFNSELPNNVKNTIYALVALGIYSKDIVEKILSASSSDLKKISKSIGCDESEVKDIQDSLKDLQKNKNLSLLPMYMSSGILNALLNNKLLLEDILLDLVSPSGRNQAAKKYMKFAHSAAKQFIGKSPLTQADLISAADEAFTVAMNTWSPEPNEKGNVIGFKPFILYTVTNLIRKEIYTQGFGVSGGSQYRNIKYGTKNLNTLSLDNMFNDDGEGDVSKLGFLGVEDKRKESPDDFEPLYKEIEKNFSERNCTIFYRYMGLKKWWGKHETGKDIAKDMGLSPARVSIAVNDVLKYLRSNKKTRDLAVDLYNMYTECLMVRYWQLSREMIVEKLMSDDTFILLEEMTPWKNASVFLSAHESALLHIDSDNHKKLLSILSGNFSDIDDNLKKENQLFKEYVGLMYPKISINKLSDISLIDKMEELQTMYKKVNKLK